jgi:hypothetical protein
LVNTNSDLPTNCKSNSGLVGLRGGVARRLSAKPFDLTEKVEKDLATYKTESSSLRNPLLLLQQSLEPIQERQ